ncbi:AAA family ATPase [Falsiporphyromonas endometrii]|uniref:AAA family ATPase n=1 Tax=Falsiporphyromonas endometrii TaxID=1387297 RepID=A0ABV9K9D5_9PORP
MDNKYTVKNFRVFDEKGVTIDVKPITILTGCNSSGKSSLVKSMILFEGFLNGIRKDVEAGRKINLSNYYLDFTKHPNNVLGNFLRVVNRDTEDNTITFEYQVYSHLLGEDVLISLQFGQVENDDLNDGYLYKVSLSLVNGELIYSSSLKGDDKVNLNLIKANFIRFAYGEFLLERFRSYQSASSMVDADSDYINEQIDSLNQFIASYEDNYGKDALIDVIWSLNRDDCDRTLVGEFSSGHPEIMDKTALIGTLFYIPIMDDLKKLSCKDIRGELDRLLKGEKLPPSLKLALDKVLEDFASSQCKTFLDFFIKMEQQFLSTTSKQVISASREERPRLLDEKTLNLNQRYLIAYSKILSEGDQSDQVDQYVDFIQEQLQNETIESMKQMKDNRVNFDLLYEVLMQINKLCGYEESPYFSYSEDPIFGHRVYHHRMFKMFLRYIVKIQEDILTLELPQEISYVSSSIVSVKRLYALEAVDDFTILLNRYFSAKHKFLSNLNKAADYHPGSFINEWIKKFEIGDRISIDVDPEGLGVTLRLYRTPSDKKGTLLSEQGYGITQMFVLLLRIEIAILESKVTNVASDRYYLGKIEFLDKEDCKLEYSSATIAIEEPEVHLHPRFQSMLANLFIDAYDRFNVNFIVETHSEYLIRKLQTLVAKEYVHREDIALVYVYDADKTMRPAYTPHVKNITINRDGSLSDSFGRGFFDEADRLAMDLLNIKIKQDEKA